MNTTHRFYISKAVVACLAVFLLIGSSTIAYAADFGGIQRQLQLWIHGDQTDATLNITTDGTYNLTYEDMDGKIHEQDGGGIAFDKTGTERNLTEKEILEQLSMPDIEYHNDGKIILYYHNQVLDITDQFNEDNVCYVKLQTNEKTLYLTIKYQNGYSISENKYISPKAFN